MSETVVRSDNAELAAGTSQLSDVTAGALLKEAREASGLHIAALAVALKVPVSKLEALESDNFAVLPDIVFARALASSVCRSLKIDSAPVLLRLPRNEGPRIATDGVGLNAPLKIGGSPSLPSSFSGTKSRSMTFLVFALLVGALVLILFPRWQPLTGNFVLGDAVKGAAKDVDGAESRDHLVSSPILVAPSPMASSVDLPAVAVPSSASRVAEPMPSASAVSLTGTGDIGVSSNISSATLVLRARGESWVQVRDSRGAIALEKKLASGESASLSSVPPLSVVVGRADMTDVFVRGKPFDLGGVSRDNVARFEVK